MKQPTPEQLTSVPTLVRYDCGCVGFPPGLNGTALLIWWCDSVGEPVGLGFRNVSKQCERSMPEKLTLEKAHSLFERLSALVSKGESYEELSSRLRALVGE
jgi:hypothetical protein